MIPEIPYRYRYISFFIPNRQGSLYVHFYPRMWPLFWGVRWRCVGKCIHFPTWCCSSHIIRFAFAPCYVLDAMLDISLLHFVVQFSSQRLFEVKIMAYQHFFHVLSTLAECVCDLDAAKLPWKKKAQGVKLIGGPTLFHFAWRFSEEGHFPSHTLHTLSSLDSAKPCSEAHATPFKSDTAHAKQRGRQVDLPSTLD